MTLQSGDLRVDIDSTIALGTAFQLLSSLNYYEEISHPRQVTILPSTESPPPVMSAPPPWSGVGLEGVSGPPLELRGRLLLLLELLLLLPLLPLLLVLLLLELSLLLSFSFDFSSSSRSRRTCSLISFTARSSFFNFMRLFWNQILTCT